MSIFSLIVSDSIEDWSSSGDADEESSSGALTPAIPEYNASKLNRIIVWLIILIL